MIRRVTAVLGLITVLLAVSAVPASAAAPSPPGGGVAVSIGPDDGGHAWSDCPAGRFCIWTGTYATGSRCTWSNADNDWYSGTTVCSWADNQPFRSAYNHGTSTGYWGVWVYRYADYSGVIGCLRQGQAVGSVSAWARSHRWRTYSC